MHLVRPIELSDLLARRTEPAEHVPFKIVLINLAACVRAIQELLTLRVRRGDTDGPGRSYITDDTDRVEIRIEHLNSRVPAIADVDVTLRVRRDRMRCVELPCSGATRPDRLHKLTVFCELRDSRIIVAIGHEDVSVIVPGNV